MEPVNEIFRTFGLVHSTSPIAPDGPETMFMTPGGTPARRASSTSAVAVKGVAEAGLMTIVQPAASAGAPLRVIIAAGKFQGVINPHTPTGCLIVECAGPPGVLGG